MKIGDLSIGDWVLMNGEPAKAMRLTMAGRSIFRGLSGQIYGSVGGDISPLPITPEILEKNGFKKNGEYNEWNIGEWNERPFIGVSLDRQSMRITYLGTDIFVVHQVVCVHQLQHALRLACVGKEIEL
ncbi:MAG: hypothetical protein E7149_02575 [Rikenellaceae bacterium]|nr:hypothetical protein [Rikenellaceae bacterium]